MTMIRLCNVAALPAKLEPPLVSDRMAAFMAEELLPMMAGSWPASANQLDANARGVALAWGGVLRGFTPAQIREVVLDMAADVDRQFAPRPAEVRAEILRRFPTTSATRSKSPRLVISIAACEMEATVTVLQRDRVANGNAVQAELDRIVTDRCERGYIITGRL
ncbi:hypothetical protein [Aeromonas sp. MdU4]|uniref:hypothetical protein n=1 Tax=Aeromonas sp. MdU4 TaxID=3342819 RepID=UPI0035B8ADFE